MLSYFSAQISQNQVMRLNPLRKDTIIFELEALAAVERILLASICCGVSK
jgi:hypothetical protein